MTIKGKTPAGPREASGAAAPPKADPGPDSFHEICSLRIDLLDTKPPIWRAVEVPTAISLKVLHDIVQIAMGWFDCHVWELSVGGKTYGLPATCDAGDTPRADANKTRLRDVLQPGTTHFNYLYDMGDNWEHRLTVTDVRQGDPEIAYPRYVGGALGGPPENSGGVAGFYEMMAARADPKHPDHAEVVSWLDDYDPDVIEEGPMTVALARLANRRNAARKKQMKTG